MELSPFLYRIFVRPKCFSRYFFHHILGDTFDFTNSVILDFGCGIGSSSVIFPSAGYIGLDCDCRRINYAKKLYPNHKFLKSNGNKVPLPNQYVDYIVILSVLHHISDQKIREYLKEFQRILKKEGSIIVIEPCNFRGSSFNNWLMSQIDKGKYIRSEKKYLNLFQTAGYHTKVIKRFRQLFLYNKIFITAKP